MCKKPLILVLPVLLSFGAFAQGTPHIHRVQSAPVPSFEVSIAPTEARTNDILTATVTPSNPLGPNSSVSYLWKKNGAIISGQTGPTLDLSKTGNGDRDDRIVCAVTVSDGQGNSQTQTSNEVTIQRSPVSVSSVSVSFFQGSESLLECQVVMSNPDGDPCAQYIQWKRNGVIIPNQTSPFISVRSPVIGIRGDQISAVVTLDDGYGGVVTKESAPVTIPNAAPHFGSISVRGTDGPYGMHYYTDSILTAVPAATDADNDSLTYAYEWKKNGVVLEGETASTLDLSKPGNGDKNDVIGLIVTANDGYGGTASQQFSVFGEGLKIENSPPQVSNVHINSLHPGTNDVLSMSATVSDADNDPYTLYYNWSKNFNYISRNPTLDLSQPGNGDRGDIVYGYVGAYDGTSSGYTESETAGVVNTAPVISSVSIDTPHPSTNSVVATNVVASDIDNDTLIYSYGWKKNGASLPDQTKAQLALSDISAASGDKISVVITANDGHGGTVSQESGVVEVQSAASHSILLSKNIAAEEQPVGTFIGALSVVGAASSESYSFSLASGVGDTDNSFFKIVGANLQMAKTFDFETKSRLSLRVRAVEAGGAILEGVLAVAVSDIPENRAPSVKVSLSPLSPTTNAILKATVVGTDADHDPVTYAYVWKRGTTLLAGETGPSLNLAKAGNGDKGETISVSVTPYDGKVRGVAAIASVQVLNSAPTITAARFIGRENKVLSGQLVASDADNEKLQISPLTAPRYGTLSLASSGAFTYTPKDNWNGTDGFTVRTADSNGATAQATITLAILPVNGVPIAQPDVLRGTEDTPFSIAAALLLKNDLNGEDRGETDALRIIKVGVPAGFPGLLKFDVAKQTLLFTPRTNWCGTTNFTYVVADSGNATASTTVTLQIAPVNDAPVASPVRMSVVSGIQGEVDLVASDVEGDALSFAVATSPQNGNAQLVKVGSTWKLRYTSKPGYSGTDTFTIFARDARVVSDPATVTVTVLPNSAPQLLGIAPNRGNFSTGTSTVFEQKVRDANGTANLDAASLVLSASSTSPDAASGAALWFDAVNNRFTLTLDDGITTLPPVALGQTLENSRVRVTLGSADVTRATNGVLSLKWHITFKSGTAGTKWLWSRAEDLGTLSAGFALSGQLTLTEPAPTTAPRASTSDTSASNS